MTDVVNVGTGPDVGDGEALRLAFQHINTALAACQAASPVTVSGLNALGLSAAVVNERVAQGTVIGNITGGTGGSTIRLASPTEYRFQVVGGVLQTGPWLLDVGATTVTLEETFDTGTATITRQTVLNITVNADNATWPAIVPTVWAAPTAQGTGDGSTAANAKAITAIPGTVAPGAIVGVRADLGTYTLAAQLALTISGTVGNPVKWVGVTSAGKRKLAKFTTGRWPYRKQTHDVEEVINLFTLSDNGIQGINAFSIGVSLQYVDFEDLAFEDVQVCFNQTGATTPANLNFRRIHCHNVQRLYEHTSTNGHTSLLFDACKAFGFSKSLIRIRGTATATTVQNCYADSQRVDNDQWATLSQIDNTASNFTFNANTIVNCHNNQGSGYWNGDGVSTEENNPGGTFINMVSKGHTDASIDLKTGADIIGGTFGDSKRIFKFWPGQSGNAKYHIEGATVVPPKKRGGTGGACIININKGNDLTLVEVRAKNEDFRLFGLAGANEIDFEDNSTSALMKYINVTRDAVPAMNNYGASFVRFMIAAAAPAGAITLTANTANLPDGSGGPIAIATNRDASYSGVIIRSIGGADGALFKVDGNKGIAQTISPVSPIAWTNTGADAKALTLTLEDISGNQVTLAFTVNVVQDTTDYRVLDVTFSGADNSQTATDASPSAKALTWGANVKIKTTIDPGGSLRVPFTANGTGTGKVFAADSADWLISGAYTIIAHNVRMDVAATTLRQTVVAQHGNGNGVNAWRLYFDGTGHPTFEIFNNSGSVFTIVDPTVRSDNTDYDLKVTRTLIAGSTFEWKLWVNGVGVASVQNTTAGFDAAATLAVGCTSASRDYMAGYIKRVAIHKGTANGT